MHHPTDRIAQTGFVTPVVENWVEREIAQWVSSKLENDLLRFVTTAKT